MRVGHALVAVGFAVIVSGCQAPPTTNIDAAKTSVDNAAQAGGAQYAPQSMKAAEDARAALDAELKAQDAKWMKSYDRANQLAAEAKAAGDKAAMEAADVKSKADAAAAVAKRRAEARAEAKAAAVKVGGKVKPPVKIKDVQPTYPTIARDARVGGAVVIEATIDKEGNVADAHVVRSVPLLDQAALDAVQQWKYEPSQQNGVPVPVVMTVTVNFTR
jgi:protein TonB